MSKLIDSLAVVNYWILNLARHPNSFWLSTATDQLKKTNESSYCRRN